MKAQFWSFDAVFGMVVFIFGIVILVYAWVTISNSYTSSSSNNAGIMQSELVQLNAVLFNKGTPINWNSVINVSNTLSWGGISIGVGSTNDQSRSVSSSKLMALFAMSNTNYQLSKEELGVAYDYYINISSSTFSIAIGKNPELYNATSINTLKEPILINGAPAQAQIMIWTNTTFGIV